MIKLTSTKFNRHMRRIVTSDEEQSQGGEATQATGSRRRTSPRLSVLPLPSPRQLRPRPGRKPLFDEESEFEPSSDEKEEEEEQDSSDSGHPKDIFDDSDDDHPPRRSRRRRRSSGRRGREVEEDEVIEDLDDFIVPDDEEVEYYEDPTSSKRGKSEPIRNYPCLK